MNFHDLVEDRCLQFRRRQIEGSLQCARKTAELMRVLITTQRHTDAQSLIEDVRRIGAKLQAARPVELAIGNMAKRVLHMIREESADAEGEKPLPQERPVQQVGLSLLSRELGPSNHNFLRAPSLKNLLDHGLTEALASVPPSLPTLKASPRRRSTDDEYRSVSEESSTTETEAHTDSRKKSRAAQWRGKSNIIEQINELIDELDTVHVQIAQAAIEHIHANEVILTIGWSTTVFRFLKEASRHRDFQVVVAEGAPDCLGQKMARQLAEAGLQTTFIPDSNVFALMSRVNKVFVGAHAVLADGGVVGRVGTHMTAMVAKRFAVPFVVLVGLHKLSCEFPQDPDTILNELRGPEIILDYGVEADAFFMDSNKNDSVVHLPTPSFDYVPPNLIDLLVTDTGGYTPSYVYRLLAEYYSRDDYFVFSADTSS